LIRQPWWRPWTVALATGVVFLVIFYARPPLWLGALSEVAILMGLLWSWQATERLRPAAAPRP
jgi:hypothetical protein